MKTLREGVIGFLIGLITFIIWFIGLIRWKGMLD